MLLQLQFKDEVLHKDISPSMMEKYKSDQSWKKGKVNVLSFPDDLGPTKAVVPMNSRASGYFSRGCLLSGIKSEKQKYFMVFFSKWTMLMAHRQQLFSGQTQFKSNDEPAKDIAARIIGRARLYFRLKQH